MQDSSVDFGDKEIPPEGSPYLGLPHFQRLRANASLGLDSLTSYASYEYPWPNTSSSGADNYSLFSPLEDYGYHNGSQAQPSNETVPFPSFPAYMQAVYSCCCALTFLVGVIGNIFVPIVVYRDRELTNSSTGAFIVNLALSDLLVLLVCNPAVIVELFSPPQMWVLPAAMCKLIPFIEFMVENASVLTIMAISLERHHVICHPLRAARACTRTRAAVICAAVWPVAAAVSSPIIVWTEYGMARYFTPETVIPVCLTRVDLFWPSIYMISLNLGFFFLPLLILIILYSRIVRQLLIDDKYLCPHKPSSNLQARKQVVVMLGTVVASFFICLLPYHVFSLCHFFVVDVSSLMSNDLYFNIIFFSRTMIYVNSAVNPVLYNLTSSRFRDSLSRILGFKKKQSSISRTSSFHPGMTLQMGVALPVITTSHHLEMSCTIPWQPDSRQIRSSSPYSSHSLKLPHKNVNQLRGAASSSAHSSPFLSHRTNSTLTISTQLSSPVSARTTCNTPSKKKFFSLSSSSSKSASSKAPFRSFSLSPNKNALQLSAKSPFLGRSATMLPSPSHLSDNDPYPYRGTQRKTCKIPTCSRAQGNASGNEEQNMFISAKETKTPQEEEKESYV